MGLIKKRVATMVIAAGIGFTSMFGLAGCRGNNNENTMPGTSSTNQSQVDENTSNIEKLQEELEKLQNELQENKGEIADLKNQLTSNNSSIATILSNISTINSTLSSIQAQLNNGADISSLQSQIDTLDDSVKNLNSALNNLQATVEGLQSSTGKPVEIDLTGITSNIASIQNAVHKLIIQSAVVNTFKNHYIEASLDFTVSEYQNGQFVPYDSSNVQLYHAPNGDFVAKSSEREGVIVKYNGLNFIKNSEGEESIEKSSTSLYEYVESGLANASGTIEREGLVYTIKSEDESTVMSLTIADALGSNQVMSVDYNDGWTEISTNYINISSQVYFEEMQTQAKTEVNAVGYYDDIIHGIDKMFDNKYIIFQGQGSVSDQYGTAQSLNGIYAISNAKIAEKATIGDEEQYMVVNKDGAFSITCKDGEVQENEMGPVTPNKKNLASALKKSINEGITSISYDAETDEYIVHGRDSWCATTLRVKTDDEMKVTNITVTLSYEDGRIETLVYTFSQATKAEFEQLFNEIEAKIADYISSKGTNV